MLNITRFSFYSKVAQETNEMSGVTTCHAILDPGELKEALGRHLIAHSRAAQHLRSISHPKCVSCSAIKRMSVAEKKCDVRNMYTFIRKEIYKIRAK